MLTAPNLAQLDWLSHGFGQRDTIYPSVITTVRQIHSCLVLEVHADGDRIAEGDGLVTVRDGMLVGIRTADCVPILLADTRASAVAAVHAGWRGTAGEIIRETLQKMRERFGTRPEDVVAAIGPSIGACCYEVGPDVARQFGTWVPELGQVEGPVRVDLKEINRLQLVAGGVSNVWVSRACTFCTRDYHSFRRDKDAAGRMISFIGRL